MPDDGSIGKVWDKPEALTYSIDNLPSKGDMAGKKAEVAKAVALACDMWTQASAFDLAPVSGTATPDIRFSFGTTGSVGLSTKAATTANTTPVTITFNDAFPWTSPETGGTTWYSVVFGGVAWVFDTIANRMDLTVVAAHEVGHALGVGHDNTHRESVMQADVTVIASGPVATVARLAGGRLPRCDAEALAAVWGTNLGPFRPFDPVNGGMVVVGGRMDVTNQPSTAQAKTLPTCSWGQHGSMQQLVAAGYCWNDFTNTGDGYGYMYLHLTEASRMATQPAAPSLVGGYVEFTNQPSTSPLVRSGDWGVQGDKAQLLGKFYAYNPGLGKEGYIYIRGVTAEPATDVGDYALIVHGGKTLKSNSGNMSSPQAMSLWGDPDKGSPISLTTGIKTYDGPWTGCQLAVE